MSALDRLLASIPRPDEKTYGDHFEAISDFALRSSDEFGHDIQTIERFGDWARRVGQPEKDLGVDSVVTTKDGKLWLVQNKGYAADREVKYRDYSTFMVEADAIEKQFPDVTMRLLVTSGSGVNSNTRSSITRSGANVKILDRTWLEAAGTYPDSWEAFKVLDLSTVKPKLPHQLREHQEMAIHRATRVLRRFPSTQLHMACGSGKTVTAFGLVESLGARTVVFFVPSLALLRQSYASWRRQSQGKIRAIAVCSDDQIATKAEEHDKMRYSDEEVPLAVMRDPEKIAAWSKQATPEDAINVIFCTYHSSELIVKAQHVWGMEELDFAFLDEAHNLVGSAIEGGERGELVKAKDDGRQRLLARYRVYATATPKLVSDLAQQRAKSLGIGALDSMDKDSPVFGPVAYTLTFGEAITLGILCEYEVLILAVSDEEYANLISERAYLPREDGTVIDAQSFAALQSIKRAYVDLRALRQFVYVNSQTSAVKFAEYIKEDPELPDADAIIGSQSVKKREDGIAKMRDTNRTEGHILTNVRCLNEGVDVERLDAIVIVDPKASPIDIGQAVGRVLRNPGGDKERGLIIIPIAIPAELWEEGKLTEDEIRAVMEADDSPYARVFQILRVISSHDETLQAWITAVSLGLGERKAQREASGNEAPESIESLSNFVHSRMGVAHAPVSAIESQASIAEGRVRILAPGMPNNIVRMLAESIKLTVARRSEGIKRTWEEELMESLVYGFNATFEKAKEVIEVKRKLWEDVAAGFVTLPTSPSAKARGGQ